MRLHLGAPAAALALLPLAWALPELNPRAACSLDRCFRSAFSEHSGASSACASFYRTTVSPCPTTSTHTRVITRTAPTSTAHITVELGSGTTESVTSIDSTVVVTKTTTDETIIPEITSTETDTTSATITSTVTSTSVTSIVTVTAGTTTLYNGPGAPQKRSVGLDERATVCTPETTTATHIPAYAASCGATLGNRVYHSVCSCVGATRTVTTRSQPTVVVTHTSTFTTTPVRTRRRTITHGGGTSVTTILSEETTTAAATTVVTSTATGASTTTTTISSVVTTTVTSAGVSTTTAPAATAYASQCALVERSGGFNVGRWLTYQVGSYEQMTFTSNSTQAVNFYLDSSGLLYSGGSLVITQAYQDWCGYLEVATPSNEPAPGSNGSPPTCSMQCAVAADYSITCAAQGVSYQFNVFADDNHVNAFLCDQSAQLNPTYDRTMVLAFDCSV